jgi:hypothetical protein
MEDDPSTLLAEQLKHAITIFRAGLDACKAVQFHYKDLTDHRLKSLEERGNDHEARLRNATDGVTQFKLLVGLATGGSGIVAIIALIRSFFTP